MSEADFDAATTLANFETMDPLGPYLSGSPELALDLDIDGRIADVVSNMKKNCACYIGCCVACLPLAPFILGCRAIGAGDPLLGGCGENEDTNRIRESAAAHKLTLCADCIVYERTAHAAEVIKNYVASDQYGHRYPAAALVKTMIPAMKLSIPISKAEVVIMPKKAVIKVRMQPKGRSPRVRPTAPDHFPTPTLTPFRPPTVCRTHSMAPAAPSVLHPVCACRTRCMSTRWRSSAAISRPPATWWRCA